MTRALVLDSSTIISISDKCLARAFEGLSRHFDLVVPKSVEYETVTRPLRIARFELNAIRIRRALSSGWIRSAALDEKHAGLARRIYELSNTLFWYKKRPFTIVQEADAQVVALAIQLGAPGLGIDERNTRMIVEDPQGLHDFLTRRHGAMRMDRDCARELSGLVGGLSVFRSTEFVALAFEQGFLEEEIDASRDALHAALFALKFAGCAVSVEELDAFLGR